MGFVKRVDVRIDRVVLHGVDPADRRALVNGLTGELSRALSDTALQAISQRTPVLRLGKMPMEAGQTGARKLGGSVARAIAKGIKR